MTTDEENTFRALNEEKLLATSLLCLMGWHKWLKWELKDVYRRTAGESLLSRSYVYHSNCVHCGILRVKTVREKP